MLPTAHHFLFISANVAFLLVSLGLYVLYIIHVHIYNLYSVKCFQHAILKELCYKMYLLLFHFNTE